MVLLLLVRKILTLLIVNMLYLFNDFLNPLMVSSARYLVYQSIKYMLHMWNIDKNIRLLSVNMSCILGNPQRR